ncbi:MAG: metal ABC transporter ATP-binding protein [Dehalococcoidia bacterium]
MAAPAATEARPAPEASPSGGGRLVCEDLAAGYHSGFQLRDVSLTAGPGEVVGLIGPNGSGKSTLLKAIAGVVPIVRGNALFGGQPLRGATSQVAYVPQREDVKWDFPASALDVVLMGRFRAAGWFRRPGLSDRRHAEDALRAVGLEGMGGRHISAFSGGQQQRIFFARAIAQEPRVLLLDEPFSGVDAENREICHRVIRRFADDGVVVLMATHDLDEVQATCSCVCCLNGRLIAFGPTATTFTAANLKATFGGRVAVFEASQ